MSLVADKTAVVLDQALNLRFRRQQLLAGNIANIDTPNYHPVDLAFEGALDRALEEAEAEVTAPTGFHQTHEMHMSPHIDTAAKPTEVVVRRDVTNSLDDNGVDLDQEMARLVENSTSYQTILEVTRRRFAILTEVLTTMGQG
jgi:flagellar basal-body rod protein FlgB